MKRLPVALAAGGLGLFAAGDAGAAPTEYCAAYAQETLAVLVAAGMADGSPQAVRDRAFYQCLNMDDEPPMPSTLAQGAQARNTAAEEDIEQGSAEADEPAIETGPQAGTRQEFAAAPARRGRSRLEPGTQKWRDWCSKHFPNSFNENTGTILPLDTGKREQC